MCVASTTAILLAALLAPSSGPAQPAPSFEGLAQRVRPGARLEIDERSGAKVTGRLVSLADDQIAVKTRKGERRLLRSEVAAVSVRGSYARWGTVVGAGVGAALCIPCTRGEHADRDAPVLTGLLGAGAGAIAGALIPRRTVLYRAADAPPALTSFAIAPTAGRGGVGVRAVLRW